MLLVIDQLEELFTQASASERDAFLAALGLRNPAKLGFKTFSGARSDLRRCTNDVLARTF